MKKSLAYLLSAFIAILLVSACGPSQEEQRQREQARQDSLQRVRQQQIYQQQMDSIRAAQEQARQDSIEAARLEEERNAITFNPNGAIAVQVEAWRSREKAQEQVDKWKSRGFPNAYVVRHGDADTGNVWFRVRLGRVSTMEMARKLGAKIQEDYNEPYWVANVVGEGSEPDPAE